MSADRLSPFRRPNLQRNAARLARAVKNPANAVSRLRGAVGEAAYRRGRRIENLGFIVGCGHSGTTLLATILATHPDIHLPLYESGAMMPPVNWRRLLNLDQEAAAAGKPFLLEKTPAHVERIAKIRGLLPGAKFIFLVRDGRDVTLSLGKRYNSQERGLARWIDANAKGAAQMDRADVLTVRYEDIVTDAARELRRICQFLGLAYTGDLLRYHEKRQVWNGAIDLDPDDPTAQRTLRVNQPIYDGRGKWRTELPQSMVERFETGEAGRLMRLFGYT